MTCRSAALAPCWPRASRPDGGPSVAGGALIQPVKKDGAFVAEEIYFSPKLRFDMGGVVKVGDYLYGTSSAFTMCVEFKTGAIALRYPAPEQSEMKIPKEKA